MIFGVLLALLQCTFYNSRTVVISTSNHYTERETIKISPFHDLISNDKGNFLISYIWLNF